MWWSEEDFWVSHDELTNIQWIRQLIPTHNWIVYMILCLITNQNNGIFAARERFLRPCNIEKIIILINKIIFGILDLFSEIFYFII